MPAPRNIVILTGACISAESGLAPIRGPGGLWEERRVEDVCAPEALTRDPGLVLITAVIWPLHKRAIHWRP